MQIIRHKIKVNNISDAERWASLIGGGLLATTALRNGSPRDHVLRLAAAGELFRRGLTGHSYLYEVLGLRTSREGSAGMQTLPYELGIRAEAAITIDRPRHEIYQFWRHLERLPRFMQHLESVVELDAMHSRWAAVGPLGKKVVWYAEIINEVPDELIAWRSLPGADVENAGSVTFKDAPGGRGTEVRVLLQYNPPAGIAGAYVAQLFGKEPSQEIEADLLRLKQYLETGEIATTEGQPKGPTKKELRIRELRRATAAKSDHTPVNALEGVGK
jgi:uncharacterized membrane protein